MRGFPVCNQKHAGNAEYDNPVWHVDLAAVRATGCHICLGCWKKFRSDAQAAIRPQVEHVQIKEVP